MRMNQIMRKAVFLDKDGTLIPDVPYNVDPALISLSQNSVIGLKQLKELDFMLIVVSNQSGVDLGYFQESALKGVERKIQKLLQPYGISIDAFYFCPHSPDSGCLCRKPRTGMFLKAAEEHAIDLNKSWMIGDILNDIEAGNKAGCTSILINNGNETEWALNEFRQPAFQAETIDEAAGIICNSISYQTQSTISI